MEKAITLEEIRIAQNKILVEMAKEGLSQDELIGLEKASLLLRNLERLLVSTFEKKLIVELKIETIALNSLTEEMKRTSDRLSELTVILRKIVKITGQVIDILDLVN
jgi:hypothetical protein